MINYKLNSQFGKMVSRFLYSTEFTDFRQIFEIVYLNKYATLPFCHSIEPF